MYPDGRINPTPAHFAKNAPVELHPPVSLRLLRQRNLDREGRAICRIVFAHGMGIQYIASVFCVAEDTVIQAIENKEVEDQEEPDNAENDYWYVSREFRELYPRSRHQETAGKTTDKVVKVSRNPNYPSRNLWISVGKKMAMDPAASVQPPSPKVMQRSALRTPAEAAPKSHPKILHAATSEISALLRNPARNRLNSIAKGGRFAASSIRTWGTTARSRRSSGCHTAPCVERC
ncbi:hypothetical protein C8J57DRAFT_658048 [Mycena rebaudengoi]|nr:hypothetical protein C8J57DRAFT_658048 [Mycena rebaudengoi]